MKKHSTTNYLLYVANIEIFYVEGVDLSRPMIERAPTKQRVESRFTTN